MYNRFCGVIGIMFLFLFIMAGMSACVQSQTSEIFVYLVRHAEKDTNSVSDPKLTSIGIQRAKDLAFVLKDAGIQHIHSSNFIRTKETVLPLAKMLGIEIQLYDHKNLDNLKTKILQQKGIHLVSGHSNSTPALVELLGGIAGGPIDEETEFDRLYILTLGLDGECTSTLLRYGDHN